MAFDLIVSQGRIGDRAAGAIRGADLLAAALEPRIGRRQAVGEPAAAALDDWRASLPAAWDTLAGLADALTASLRAGRVPVVVANTCSASIATLPVVAQERPEAVVLWFDAHGDFNTPETTETGYLGGMVLSAACGLWDSGHGAGLRPERVVLVGARDIDPAEDALLRQAGVRVLPPAEATPEAVLAALGRAPAWVHIDWDVLEPGFVPAAYKVPDGPTPAQIRAILKALPADSVAGIELAEFVSSGDAAVDDKAVAAMLDTVAPLVPAS